MSVIHRVDAWYLRARKAVHGAVIAAAPLVTLALQSDSPGGSSLVAVEVAAIVFAVLGVGGGVYATRNRTGAAVYGDDRGSTDFWAGLILGGVAALLWVALFTERL